eukprot:gene8777-11853_t
MRFNSVWCLLFVTPLTFALNSPKHDQSISNKQKIFHRSKFETLLYPTASIKSPKKSTLFKSSPEIRKVIISYLNNKLFHETNRFACCKQKIKTALISVVPPVNNFDIDSEVDEMARKFEGKPFMEEFEFSSRVIMENKIWETVGETVVKELIYLDSVNSKLSGGIIPVSQNSLDKLEASLQDDGSLLPKLSHEETKKVFSILAQSNGTRTVENTDENAMISPGDLPFIGEVDKDDLRDSCGNPTLLTYVADLIYSQNLKENVGSLV